MASIPVIPAADSDECMSKPDCPSLSKQQQTEPSSESATTDQHTNGNGDVGTGHDSHGEAIWSPEEVFVSSSHAASNGHARSNGAHSSANGFGDGQPAASNGVNERSVDDAVQSSSDVEEKGPLKRMSWMQDSSVAQNGTANRPSLATNGHARSQDNANGDAAALDDDGTGMIGQMASMSGNLAFLVQMPSTSLRHKVGCLLKAWQSPQCHLPQKTPLQRVKKGHMLGSLCCLYTMSFATLCPSYFCAACRLLSSCISDTSAFQNKPVLYRTAKLLQFLTSYRFNARAYTTTACHALQSGSL